MIKYQANNFLMGLAVLGLMACTSAETNEVSTSEIRIKAPPTTPQLAEGTDTAILAGGCFWCIEKDFEDLDGVVSVVSGYTGGETINPTYKQVTFAETGHYEAVKVTYKTDALSYNDILTHFWHHIDPTDPYGQFCDKGSSYRTAIFARDDQIETAQKSKSEIENTKPFKADIVTPVLKAAEFFDAEEYHQDFYKKNPAHYNRYRKGCRRDARVNALWGGGDAGSVTDTAGYGSGK